VVYRDWGIFCGMPNYADGPMSPHYLRLEQQDLFAAENDRGHELGPRGSAAGSWPPGSTTMDVSKAAVHFGEKPWRRFFFVLAQRSGEELTLDNGKEFAEHDRLTAEAALKLYFAKSYCAWQHGTNENTNGLIWESFSKDTELTSNCLQCVQ